MRHIYAAYFQINAALYGKMDFRSFKGYYFCSIGEFQVCCNRLVEILESFARFKKEVAKKNEKVITRYGIGD